jgi:hypothetical protein
MKRRTLHGRNVEQHGTATRSALFGEGRADCSRCHDNRKMDSWLSSSSILTRDGPKGSQHTR